MSLENFHHFFLKFMSSKYIGCFHNDTMTHIRNSNVFVLIWPKAKWLPRDIGWWPCLASEVQWTAQNQCFCSDTVFLCYVTIEFFLPLYSTKGESGYLSSLGQAEQYLQLVLWALLNAHLFGPSFSGSTSFCSGTVPVGSAAVWGSGFVVRSPEEFFLESLSMKKKFT